MNKIIFNGIIDLPNQVIINFTNNTGKRLLIEIKDVNQPKLFESADANIKLVIYKDNVFKKIFIIVKDNEEIIYLKRFVIEKNLNITFEKNQNENNYDFSVNNTNPWSKKIKLNENYSHNGISQTVIEKLNISKEEKHND